MQERTQAGRPGKQVSRLQQTRSRLERCSAPSLAEELEEVGIRTLGARTRIVQPCVVRADVVRRALRVDLCHAHKQCQRSGSTLWKSTVILYGKLKTLPK